MEGYRLLGQNAGTTHGVLRASNYVMQILNAPSRKQVNDFHTRVDWPRSGPVRTVAFFGDC